MSVNDVWIPGVGVTARFTHRDVMRARRPMRGVYRTPPGLPEIPLPIDWTQNDKLTFAMLGNDRKGDCMYVMGLHQDNTWTGNWGPQSTFDTPTVIQYYTQLSGGDNGLDELTLNNQWLKGLAGDPHVSILDSLDIDVTDQALVASGIYLFGGVCETLSVPNKWINDSSTGAVWDAPARPNPFNGHGVLWNGMDEQGRRKTQTWGTHVWMTQAGTESCDSSGWINFSLRWFDPRTGMAPNGLHYVQAAQLWQGAGGKALPPNPFPPPSLPPIA